MNSGDIAALQQESRSLAVEAAMRGARFPMVATIRTPAPIVVKGGRTGFALGDSAGARAQSR
ncbi:hypothetical protein BRAS3809_1870005 [Bradyrhizobium sp. STM 3809]|nr:hypothetical protein BRAS3809_1870005 [Bradyrhizobium sp. STM 3809]